MKHIIPALFLVCLVSFMFAQSGQFMIDNNGNRFVDKTLQTELPSYSNQDKAGNEWVSIGPFGGDVVDLAFDPINTDITFAAAGFAYKRIGAGDNWHVIDQLNTLSPNGIHCFEASGNGTIYAAGNYSFGKVYLSTDSGETWLQKNLPVQTGVYDIAVDPSDTAVVYLAFSSNISGSQNKVIVKSTDGGANWTAIDMTSWLPVGWACTNIAVDPDNGQVIFAIGDEGISNAKLIKTTDGGTSWSDVTNGLPSGKPFNTVSIFDGIVYVTGGQLFGGNWMGVYKSTDYGSSWQNISGSFPNKVANDIIINPDDANKMFVATEGDGVYYTLDGGTTWNYNTNGPGDNGSARKLLFHPDDPETIYAGFLSLGVCFSEDNSLNWESSTVGIASLKLNDIEIDPNDPTIVLAAFEAENSGGCYMQTEGEWNLVNSLPGTRFSAVNIGIDGTLYAWSNGPTTVAAEGLYKSTDGGDNWENIGPNIGSYFETEIWHVELSQSDPDLILIGGNNFGLNGWESMIYRSTDGGETWVNVFMGPANDSFKYISIDPNSDDKTIYAAYKSESAGGFIKSLDGGNVWLPINNGLPPTAKWAGAILCDSTNSDIVYGGLGGYGGIPGTIFKSIDGGSNWIQTSVSMSNYCKVTDFMISPLDHNVVYAATSYDGVFMAEDGETWQAANDGLPAGNITGFSSVYQDENESWLFLASTFTNSAFLTTIWESTGTGMTLNNEVKKGFVIFPNPASEVITIDLGHIENKSGNIKIYNLAGKEIRTTKVYKNNVMIKISVDKLGAGIYWIVFKNEYETFTEKLVIVK